jgi:hypothetical protein
VSVPLDPKARDLIRRAYAVKGSWAGDFLSPPGPRARAWAAGMGIDLYERDRWGELRYIRAYKRACFWQLNNYGRVSRLGTEKNIGAGKGGWNSPVRGEWQTGIRPTSGPHVGEWAVRFRIHPGGKTTSKIGKERALRLGENWIDEDGEPTFRQSTPADRNWEPEFEEDILPPARRPAPESEILEEARKAAAYRAMLLRKRLGLE